MRLLERRCVLAAATLILATGCPKNKPEPTEPGIGAHVQRGKEKQVSQSELGQLGLYYIQYYDSSGQRSPTKLEDLPDLQRDLRHLAEAIRDGTIVVNWGVKDPNSSNVVLAYEKDPDLRGNHVVLKGDRSVVTMTTQELKAALPNR
jgi:hypothetical protein